MRGIKKTTLQAIYLLGRTCMNPGCICGPGDTPCRDPYMLELCHIEGSAPKINKGTVHPACNGSRNFRMRSTDEVIYHLRRGTLSEVYTLMCANCHQKSSKLNKHYTTRKGECKYNNTKIELFNGQFDLFGTDQSTEVPPNGDGRGYPPVRVSPVVRVPENVIKVTFGKKDLALSSPDNQAPETLIGTSKAVRE